jgi:hypothetical protein
MVSNSNISMYLQSMIAFLSSVDGTGGAVGEPHSNYQVFHVIATRTMNSRRMRRSFDAFVSNVS